MTKKLVKKSKKDLQLVKKASNILCKEVSQNDQGGETKVVVLKPNAGEILTSEIEKRGLKLTYVAKKAGVEYTYASAVLSGRKRLTTEKALQIAKAIGLSYEKILN